MEKIGELLNKKSSCDLVPPGWLYKEMSGYLDRADMVMDRGTGITVVEVGGPLGSKRIQRTGFGMQLPLKRQPEYKVAQVVSYEPALKLLAKLYDKVTLSVSSLENDQNGNMVVAVGMLAAAGLCDVSPEVVRLSVAGKEFVEFLVGDESSVSMQD